MARTRRLLSFLALAHIVSGAPIAVAQDSYPSRPIRLVVPYPPGGLLDILARLIAPRLGDDLKQSVLIDNRGGANGNIGVEAVAKSLPDGYTLLFGQVANLAINPALYPTVPFDPIGDLAPIGLVASAPQLMVTPTGSKLQSVADVLAAARARPGEVTFASSGNGSMAHMCIELMQISAGIKFLHIPYKGAGPAIIDVLGGRAELFISAMPATAGQIRAGKLRPIAITSAQRKADLPDIPTLAESGFPGFEAGNWLAILGRAGTPGGVIARLNAALNATLSAPDVRAKLEAEGATVLGGTPQQLAVQLATDLAKWKRVVGQAGLKIE